MSGTDGQCFVWPYDDLLRCDHFRHRVEIRDHLDGFNSDLTNHILDHVHAHSNDTVELVTDFRFVNDEIIHYPKFRFAWHDTWVNDCFMQYRMHPELDYQNFLCSFNGTAHVGRQLLVSYLHRMGWFDVRYVSKNFSYTVDQLDGHLRSLVPPEALRLYRKFFIGPQSQEFFATLNGFGHVRFDHANNIYNLEKPITHSFLHLVSESLATSGYPFVTEKFLYSVITRGLFLAWAQPGWHRHLEQHWGFRRYTKIFDYAFDEVQDPVQRLVALMDMIAKFARLGPDDWRDIYEIEKHTIAHNYEWYFSRDYKNFRYRHD